MIETDEIDQPALATPEIAPEQPPAVVEPATTAEPPKTALDAMSKALDRDEKGRFVAKAGDPAPAATPAATEPEAPKPEQVAPKEEDITAMPDGLGPKAQERFQKLASTNRELTERVSMAEQQLGYVRDTFQTHGIQREQFEQAVGIIGAMNRGDFAAAQQMLVEQLRQVSLLTGQTVAGVDALSDFPELRQQVDSFQMTEAAALELARMRKAQAALQGRQQAQVQASQQRQASEAAFNKARSDVDAWVASVAAKDLDWPAIEEQLLPEVGNLLQGVPPERWLPTLQTQHKLLKQAAARLRGQGQSSEPSPLRPAAAGAVQRPPRNALEAMNAALGL